MKTEKIKIGYSTSIPIAAYGIKDNIWAEEEINTEGEPIDHKVLTAALKNKIDAAVKELYPHLYAGSNIANDGIPPSNGAGTILSWPPPEPKIINVAAERLLVMIENAATLEELESYQADAEKYGLQLAYHQKLKTIPLD